MIVKRSFRGIVGLSAVVVMMAACQDSVRAAVVTYSIVQSSSQINLTAGGTLFGGALTVTEQHANAITRYNGSIVTDVTIGGPDFVGGSSANAVNPTGLFSLPLQYSPNIGGGAGTAPANYGLNMTAPVSFVIPSFSIPQEIRDQYPFLPATLSLGTLSSVVAKVALRDVTLDILSDDRILRSGNDFDANLANIDISGGFSDINIAARLTQPDLLTKAAMQLLLSALAGAFPDLGLTVTSPGLFSLDIDVGFGFRVDLAGLPAVPNLAAADGTITGLGGPPGPSTLTLPIEFGLDPIIDVLPQELIDILGGFLDLDFEFSGVLVATATVPEPSALALTGLAAAMAFGGVYYRRRSQ